MLRNTILDGKLEVGQKWVEHELCDLVGASRSSLREALVNLEAACDTVLNGLTQKQADQDFNPVGHANE